MDLLQQEGEQMWGLEGCFKLNCRVLIWLPHLKSTVRSLTAHPGERFISKAGLSGSREGRAVQPEVIVCGPAAIIKGGGRDPNWCS